MTKVLVLVADKKKRVEYLSSFLRNAHKSDILYEEGSLEELSFSIGDNETVIYNQNGADIASYDLVVFRTIGKYKQEAVTVAAYCRMRGVRYIDSMIDNVFAIDDENKLAEMLVLRLAGVSVPATAYGSLEYLTAQASQIGYPVILKAIDGKKGRSNYLVTSEREIVDLMAANPDIRMLLQQYIPNDQDYRVLVLDYQHVVVTLRKRKSNTTHLNNVSAGGEEILIENQSGIEDVIEQSIRAAQVLSIEVAGVDIVIDKRNGCSYIMEVNRAPQLTLKEEIQGYFEMIEEKLHGAGREPRGQL